MEQLHLFDTLLTADEVAEILGVHKQTVSVWRKEKRGPRYLKIGNRVYYDPQDLDAWLESRKTQ